MILDKIENAHLYVNLSNRIAQALEIIKDTEQINKDDGRYDIDGDNLYYMVQRYESTPAETHKFEAHQKYIDIQFIAEGSEIIGYAPLGQLDIDTPYSDDCDAALYKIPQQYTDLKMDTGSFCILFPKDAHMPGCQNEKPENIHKIVVKVKINA